MDEMLDRTLLDADYKKACYKMAEAMLSISDHSWSHLGPDTKNILIEHLVNWYLKEDEYVPKHAK